MADADFSVKAIISAQTSQFEKGIKNAQSSINTMSKSIEGVQKLLKTAFSMVGITVGIKAVTDFGKSCVQSANQASKAFNILDNTVRATGADAWTSTEKLVEASKTLSDSTNYSITEIQKMQSVLLGFTNITGEAFDGASDAVLDMATVMGMDLTSAVQTVGKALDDPITGLDSLRRQGFKFTDEQKAELARLVRTGKQMEAQKIILNTLATSYGGAAKAGQDSFAKQRHAVENFRDTLGTKLIPLMKSFAIDNANTINSLRESLDKIDFNQIGAVIKVTFDGIKKGIQNSFEYIKKIFSETKSLLKNIDFKPIVSIINNLVSAFEKIGKINLSRITDIIKNLKDSFSGFSENIDLTKFSEVINLMINGFVFLYEEANNVFDTLLDNIKTFITNTWNSIKSIFEAGNKALADSEADIKSWGDYFYTIFNNLFKTVQDVIQSISYLLSGDWEIAWEYAKLVVLRIVDSIIDSMTTIITAFKDKIISMLNIAQVLSPFGTTIKTALTGIELLVEGVDKHSKEISDSMNKMVSDTEAKIEELTGKPADKNLKDLDLLASGSENALGKFVDNFKEATDKAKKELDNLRGEYKATTSSMGNDTKSTYKAFSEWDSKLLQQRLEHLSDWSKEYHEINLQLIEEERKKALENEGNEEEREKINKYYNDKIEEENKRFEDAKKERIRNTLYASIEAIKKVYSTMKSVFSKITSIIKDVFSKTLDFIKNTLNTIKNIFSKLFEFNVSDALDNLLEIEDAILTFFVETLPQLPAFFESALNSIIVLIQTLINSIDFEQFESILSSILDSLITNIPTITDGIVNIFSDMISNIVKVLKKNYSKIPKLLDNVLKDVGKLVKNILKVLKTIDLKTVVSDILKTLSDNLPGIITDMTEIVIYIFDEVVSGLIDWLGSGNGLKTILDLVISIQQSIEKVVTDNLDKIADMLAENVDTIGDFLAESMSSANRTLPKLIKSILKIIKVLIDAIAKAFQNEDFVDSIVESIEGVVDAIIEIVPSLLESIIGLIFAIINAIIPRLPEIILYVIKAINKSFKGMTGSLSSIVSDGLSSLFKKVFTKEFWWDVLQGLWETITGMFSSIGDIMADAFGVDTSSGKNTAKDVGFNVLTGGIYGGVKKIGDWFNWWADGSNAVPKGLSIVGEAGPELVNFRGGEQVINNKNTQKLLANSGKGNNVFNVTFNNTQDTTAFTMMQQLKAYNRQMAINSVF